MRRFLAVGALVGLGVLVVRPHLSKVRERLMAQCEAMFERMPETFPPKRMTGGIEQVRADTARILELLEARSVESDEVPGSSAASAAHDAA